MRTLFLLLLATAVPACRPAQAEDGVIGATCSAAPFCPNCGDRTNVCRSIKDKFYPGILQAVARKAVVKECQEANALDPCGDHCKPEERESRMKKYGSCYSQCEKVANCMYGDNR